MKFLNKITGKDKIAELSLELLRAQDRIEELAQLPGKLSIDLMQSQVAHEKAKIALSQINQQHIDYIDSLCKAYEAEQQEKLAAKDAEIEAHKKAAHEHEAHARSLKVDLESADACSAASQQARANVQDQFKQLMDDHSQLNASYAALKEDHIDCGRAVDDLEKTIARQVARIGELMTTLAQSEKSKQSLVKELEEHSQLVENLRNNYAKKDDKIDALEVQIDQLTKKLKATEDLVNLLESGLRTSKEVELQEELDALKTTHDHCLRYGGKTAEMLLKHRNDLVAETESLEYKKYKIANGLK